MKKLIILQHAEAEHLGIWEEELKRWHAPYAYVPLFSRAGLPAADQTLAAIVMGGPMNVEEQPSHPFLAGEIDYLKKLHALDTPILGVCLGAQLLAKALGAEVKPGPRPEIGYAMVTLTPHGAEDTLLSGFPMELSVFQWHRQGFSLPPSAVCLAANVLYPQQAFRLRKSWGFQFHLEVTPEMVSQWAQAGASDLRDLPGVTPAVLSEQAQSRGHMVTLYGRQVIRRFWEAVAEM